SWSSQIIDATFAKLLRQSGLRHTDAPNNFRNVRLRKWADSTSVRRYQLLGTGGQPLRHRIERGEDHLMGEIARRAEEH
ncbi:MAG: hypothetical protein WBW33_12845, partial [Bryobacteraceae bacterium]